MPRLGRTYTKIKHSSDENKTDSSAKNYTDNYQVQLKIVITKTKYD